jgi:hypothetical protein
MAEHDSNVSVDRFVMMPNHVHAIIVIEGQHQYSGDDEGEMGQAPPSHSCVVE